MIGSNGRSFPGAFTRNPSAALPDSSFSYQDFLDRQKALQVPQTAPSNMTPNGLAYSIKMINGVATYVIEHPTRRNTEWRNQEIYAPPEEYLAKQDIERQKKQEKEMMSQLSPEQKELLRKLDAGELFGKSKLIEESNEKAKDLDG